MDALWDLTSPTALLSRFSNEMNDDALATKKSLLPILLLCPRASPDGVLQCGVLHTDCGDAVASRSATDPTRAWASECGVEGAERGGGGGALSRAAVLFLLSFLSSCISVCSTVLGSCDDDSGEVVARLSACLPVCLPSCRCLRIAPVGGTN